MIDTNNKIVARYMHGVNVIGYRVQMNDGRVISMTKEEVERMAINKQIDNVTAQRYTQKNGSVCILLKGIGFKLKDLPKYEVGKPTQVDNRLEIQKRIIDGKSTIGYVVIDVYNNEKNIKKETIIELAKNGRIRNARVQRDGDKILLRGKGCNITDLPVIRANELTQKAVSK